MKEIKSNLWSRTKEVAGAYTGIFILVMLLNQLLFFGFCLNPICIIAAMPHVLLLTVAIGTLMNKLGGWGKKGTLVKVAKVTSQKLDGLGDSIDVSMENAIAKNNEIWNELNDELSEKRRAQLVRNTNELAKIIQRQLSDINVVGAQNNSCSSSTEQAVSNCDANTFIYSKLKTDALVMFLSNARSSDIEVYKNVKILLEEGADPNGADAQNKTLLHICVSQDLWYVAEMLIDRGANMYAADSRGWMPMHTCSRFTSVKTAEVMLKRGFQLLEKSSVDHPSLLHFCARYNNLALAQLLIQYGFSIHLLYKKEKYTPMHICAIYNSYDLAKYLIDSNLIDLKSNNGIGYSPDLYPNEDLKLKFYDMLAHVDLISSAKDPNEIKANLFDGSLLLCAKYNSFEVANLLLTEWKNSRCGHLLTHKNFIDECLQSESRKILKLFVENGVKVTFERKVSCDYLEFMVRDLGLILPKHFLIQGIEEGDIDYVSKLVGLGVDLDHLETATLKKTETALMACARTSNYRMAELLLNHGADPNSGQDFGFSPLRVCAYTISDESDRIADLLLMYGADVNFRSTRGWTALHTAVRIDNISVVTILLKHKALKDIKNDNGQTAIDIASFYKSIHSIKLLNEF